MFDISLNIERSNVKSMDVGIMTKFGTNTSPGESNLIDISSSSILGLPNNQRPARVYNVLQNILKNTFRNNHIEDLKLSSLNMSQRNYLKKLLKDDQAKLPFKMPYNEERGILLCYQD